jgi:cbb3-type cytochrome oxidase subunit 1
MNNIDRWFILMAIVYALGGMILGLWMGMKEDYTHVPLHAHINLVGWATMALFGVLYRLYPKLAGSRLALPHFALFALGTPVMLFGIPIAHSGGSPLLAVAGSFAVLAGMALFLVIFARRGTT